MVAVGCEGGKSGRLGLGLGQVNNRDQAFTSSLARCLGTETHHGHLERNERHIVVLQRGGGTLPRRQEDWVRRAFAVRAGRRRRTRREANSIAARVVSGSSSRAPTCSTTRRSPSNSSHARAMRRSCAMNTGRIRSWSGAVSTQCSVLTSSQRKPGHG